MNHSINKWQQNKQKCIQGSLSGTERCDSWHLSSYRYSLSPVCLFTLSPSLSCTLHPLSLSPTESGWPGMSSPTDSTASHSQTGAVCNALDFRQALGGVSRGLPPRDHYHSTIQMYGQRKNHSSQKLMGDYFLSQCWSQWKVHECSSQIN